MPNRIIRESCRTSATLAQLSADAERLFWRLTTVADDYGRFEADPRIVRGACFPLQERITSTIVDQWLQQLAVGDDPCIRLYAVDGKRYGVFLRWERHQIIRAKASKHPMPPVADDTQPLADVSTRQQTLTSDILSQHMNPYSYSNTYSGSGSGPKTKPPRSAAFTPPTPTEVEAYAKTINFVINGEKFCAHYEASGWMRGRTRIKDWHACVRTWKSTEKDRHAHAAAPAPTPGWSPPVDARLRSLAQVRADMASRESPRVSPPATAQPVRPGDATPCP